MRVLLIPILGFALIGASDKTEVAPSIPEEPALLQQYQERVEVLKNREALAKLKEGVEAPASLQLPGSPCRDRLKNAQEAEETPAALQAGPLANLRLFRRQPATPETPLAIYAIDRREAGCGVMVMMGNLDDVRPVPLTNQDDYRLMPAETLKGD